ncbi:MAG TPA: cytochrome c [Terracidiphilus sp.]|nr:cytochrome c [Terracidiphilus sp.]
MTWRSCPAPWPIGLAVVTFALISSVAILNGCRGEKPLTDQQLAGKHLYDVRCAHCHEDNDLDLKKVPPNLHAIFTQSTLPSGAPATDLQVERTVLSGKGMMPSFAGRFTQQQMTALLAYLHTGLR